MKKLFTAAVVLFLASAAAPSPRAAQYKIDTSHSEVDFKVKHLTISWVKGSFQEFSGSFDLPDEGYEGASVEAVIKVASVDTGTERRDNHLRSADFFDVANYPDMTFKSKAVTDISGDTFKVVGDLTLRGTTKEVVLDVELTGKVKDPWGNDRVAFTAQTAINRQDFGVKWSQVLEAGGLVVSDEVQIMLEIEAVREKQEADQK